MRLQFAIPLTCSVVLASTAWGQISTFTLDGKGNTFAVTFYTPRGRPMPAVTGAPYSADEVTENIQTLADGTHVNQRKNVRHIVRDPQGTSKIK
jgi:hypothetical protein